MFDNLDYVTNHTSTQLLAHRGLDNKALQTLVMPEFSRDIVDELGEQSATLTDLNENFAKIAHQLQILSCYELRPTPTVVQVSQANFVIMS